MTVPEWAVICILSSIGIVLWWGVKRLVQSNDETSQALTGINGTLAAMNTRLGKSESWMDAHDKQDDERHQDVKQEHHSMWEAVEKLRT